MRNARHNDCPNAIAAANTSISKPPRTELNTSHSTQAAAASPSASMWNRPNLMCWRMPVLRSF